MRKVIMNRFFCLVLFCGWWIILAGCSAGADDPAAPAVSNDSEITDELQVIEQDVHQQINAYRQTQGLSSLQWNEVIADSCQTHSLNMAAGSVAFGHDGFDQRVADISQAVPYTSAAENVASNKYADPATAAVQGWLTSPGHLVNIQGDFHLTGIGVAQGDDGTYYLTQIFIKEAEN